jgi:hypothetical protein
LTELNWLPRESGPHLVRRPRGSSKASFSHSKVAGPS